MAVRTVLIVVCIGLSACSDPDVCDQMDMPLTIKNQAGQTASTFSVGETVTLVSRLTNRGFVTQTLEVPATSLVEYHATDENGDGFIGQSIGDPPPYPPVTLAPGETEEQVFVWDLNGTEFGQPFVPAGSYTVTAHDKTECAPALTESKTITVVGP